jgi:hypothetical protein
MNITINVPFGTTNHGDPNQLCLPSGWLDYVFFFLGNYLAHAVTVVTYPGQGRTLSIALMVSALFLPTSGVVRAAQCILSHAATSNKNPLVRAARAGALYMVIDTNR